MFFYIEVYFQSPPPPPPPDWDERDEDGSDRQLWEDNWDDDNVEDEFSSQLRYVEPGSKFLYPIHFTDKISIHGL